VGALAIAFPKKANDSVDREMIVLRPLNPRGYL